MKHTPGQWEVRNTRAPVLAIYKKTLRMSAGRIASVPIRDGYTKVADANARLIAAAPELLEACKTFLTQWREKMTSDGVSVPDKGIDLAVKAIAKAEGRS